jgi:hypothetical protein
MIIIPTLDTPDGFAVLWLVVQPLRWLVWSTSSLPCYSMCWHGTNTPLPSESSLSVYVSWQDSFINKVIFLLILYFGILYEIFLLLLLSF